MNNKGPKKRRRIIVAAIIVTVVIVVPAVFFTVLSLHNAAASREWLSRPARPGSLVDIGGRSLYCTVRGTGRPAVIIEADLGSTSPEWWQIQERLSGRATVVTYDRAGYGWSGSAPLPRSLDDITGDMVSLLSALGLKGPCVFIGQGLGALYVQYYALKNPGKTSGLVLVSPVTVDYPRLKKELSPVIYKNLLDRTPGLKITSFLAGLGVIRFFKAVPYLNVPPEVRPFVVEQYSLEKSFNAMLDEYAAGLKKNIASVIKAGSFTRRPVTVVHHSPERYTKELMSLSLSYDEAGMIEKLYDRMDRAVVSHSSSGRLLYSGKAVKDLQFNDPDLIIQAAEDMIKRAR
ncbi:MAG TPA: alpha/beta hydrolase [Spirochaetota bacterium]|nr:alpha/beta hydrolase [Spirochaetota bacterium]HPI89500.1 alpha/beta hydrolase [Spirochaetota bacterium]HPR49573.1 alpha/beta hydrolase [Spirochaetota bacterium]